MRVTIVCAHCGEPTRDTENALVEINFLDSHIHFLCPKCKRMNKLQLKKPDERLPKSRRLGQ